MNANSEVNPDCASNGLLAEMQGASYAGKQYLADGLVRFVFWVITASVYALIAMVLIESAEAQDFGLHVSDGKCFASNQVDSDLTSKVSFYSTLRITSAEQNIVPLLRKSILELPPEGGNIRIEIKDRAIWNGALKISRSDVGLYFFPAAGVENPEITAVEPSLDLLALTGDRITVFGGNWQVNGSVQRSVIFAKDVVGVAVWNADFNNSRSGAEKYKIGKTYTAGVRLQGVRQALIKCNSFRNMFFDIYAKQVEKLEVSHNVAGSHRDAQFVKKRIGGGFIRLEVASKFTVPNSKIDIHHNLVKGYHEGSYGGHLVNLQLGHQSGRSVQLSLHRDVNVVNNIFDVRVNGQTRPSEILPGVDAREYIRNGASGDVIAIKAAEGFEVSQNAIYGSGEYAITVIASKGSVGNVGIIRNNTIVNSDGAAIVIGREAIGKETEFPKSRYIEVTENIVSGTSQMLSKENAGIARIKKARNWSKANAWGSVRIRGAENVSVFNNVFTDIVTYGIWLRNSDRGILIENNAFDFRANRLPSYSEGAEYDYGATWATGVEVQLDNKKIVNGQTLSVSKVEQIYRSNKSVEPDIAIDAFTNSRLRK